MIKFDSGNVDSIISEFYTPYVLGSLKHGENRVCLWFPGCGKTSSLNLVLSNKKYLHKYLGLLYPRLIFLSLSGLDSINGTCDEVLGQLNKRFNPKSQNLEIEPIQNIINYCQKNIDLGKEIVLIVNEIENLPSNEYLKLLNSLLKIVLVNRSRIHTITNIKNEEMLMTTIAKNNSLLTLANKTEYVPVLTGKILEKLIKKFVILFEKNITQKEIDRIINYSGGISIVTKEIIRSYPDKGISALKFQECLRHINRSLLSDPKYLSKYQINNLKILKDLNTYSTVNPIKNFKNISNEVENKLIVYLEKSKNKLINRDEIAEIIWKDFNDIDYSDWAIDQIISRFRKKLKRAGIDPQRLN